MPKLLISRIEERLQELRLSKRAASLRVSRNPDLFRSVMREGDDANPTQRTLELLAEAIELPVEDIVASGRPQRRGDEVRAAPVRMPNRNEMPNNLGVMGTAAGSIIKDVEGFVFFSDMPVDYVRRPPALALVRESYAVFVAGDSMFPAHPAGELRFVNPAKPVAIGDTVIVRTKHWDDDPGQLYIKTLVKRTPDEVILEQLNPVATIRIPRKYVEYVHHVMTMSELFGI